MGFISNHIAINNACLVYDSRLVINPEHFTNDPCILGAGPLTKFSRYYRTPWYCLILCLSID